MRWLKLIKRYSLVKRPTLKAANPRTGTSVIPLDSGDGQILFYYLTDKIHALTFEGTEAQLVSLINKIREEKGCTVRKMKTSVRKGRSKLVLLHLELANNVEVRRLIHLA